VVSTVAFNINLRRYTLALSAAAECAASRAGAAALVEMVRPATV